MNLLNMSLDDESDEEVATIKEAAKNFKASAPTQEKQRSKGNKAADEEVTLDIAIKKTIPNFSVHL